MLLTPGQSGFSGGAETALKARSGCWLPAKPSLADAWLHALRQPARRTRCIVVDDDGLAPCGCNIIIIAGLHHYRKRGLLALSTRRMGWSTARLIRHALPPAAMSGEFIQKRR